MNVEPHLRFGPARLWSRVWRWFREHMGHVEKALVVPVFSEARRPAYIMKGDGMYVWDDGDGTVLRGCWCSGEVHWHGVRDAP